MFRDTTEFTQPNYLFEAIPRTEALEAYSNALLSAIAYLVNPLYPKLPIIYQDEPEESPRGHLPFPARRDVVRGIPGAIHDRIQLVEQEEDWYRQLNSLTLQGIIIADSTSITSSLFAEQFATALTLLSQFPRFGRQLAQFTKHPDIHIGQCLSRVDTTACRLVGGTDHFPLALTDTWKDNLNELTGHILASGKPAFINADFDSILTQIASRKGFLTYNKDQLDAMRVTYLLLPHEPITFTWDRSRGFIVWENVAMQKFISFWQPNIPLVTPSRVDGKDGLLLVAGEAYEQIRNFSIAS